MQEVTPQQYNSQAAAAGVSSFGMSGVNAHAVFAQGSNRAVMLLDSKTEGPQWRQRRHWPVPSPHHFLQSTATDRRSGVCRCATPDSITFLAQASLIVGGAVWRVLLGVLILAEILADDAFCDVRSTFSAN